MKNTLKKQRFFSLSIILCICISATAFTDNRFNHLTISDGLAHTDVTSLRQDKSGMLWIGSNGGLQSYDGYELTSYDYYSKHMRIMQMHSRIICMDICDKYLWIGTESGLLRFNTNTHHYSSLNTDKVYSKLLQNPVKVISANEENKQIWISNGKNLVLLNQSNSSEIYLSSSVSKFLSNKRNINSINQFGKYTLISDSEMIYIFIGEKYINKISRRELGFNVNITRTLIKNNCYYIQTSNSLYKMKIMKDGNLDITTKKEIIFDKVCININKISNNNFIIDSNDTYWGVSNSGLVSIEKPFESPKVRIYTNNPNNESSLSSDFISTIFQDSFNNLWIGTWGKGLNYHSIEPSPFGLISNKNDLFKPNDNFVTGIDKDEDDNLWVTTQKGGLNCYDSKFHFVKNIDFVSLNLDNRIFKKVLVDKNRKDIIYIGTIQGLIEYNKSNNHSRIIIGSKNTALIRGNINVIGLHMDKNQLLWISTWNNGIFAIDKKNGNYSIKKHICVENNNKMLSNRISFSFYDKEKNEFLLGTDNGINRMILDDNSDIKKIVKYQTDENNKHSLSNNFVVAIAKESNTSYWIGTIGGGLNHMIINSTKDNDYKATFYDKEKGMTSNDIEIVMLDKNGYVWTGGNGISRLDSKSGHIIKYDRTDGLQSNVFKFGTGFKDKNGMLYMGGTDGLNYFIPETIKTKVTIPNIILTDLYVHNNKVDVLKKYNNNIILPEIINNVDKLELHHDQNDFTIHFAALDYKLSNRIMYRYRLHNYNKNWQIVPAKGNKVSFSNLDYDSYRFEIQVSCDGGLTWNDESKILNIEILAPWWWTWFAKFIYILLIIGLIYLVFYIYVHELNMKHKISVQELEKKKEEENHQMKLQFFMNISHELKTPLTIILSAVENLINKDNIHETYYQSITKNANKLLSLINELVDFRKGDLNIIKLKPRMNNIGIFVKNIVDDFIPWATKKGINIKFKNENIDMPFDSEVVTKIIFNLISNAIKYTDKGGNIEIKVLKTCKEEIAPTFKVLHTEGQISDTDVCAIIVKDSGIGITQDSISHIYDRFFQVETKSSAHLGSGIGLAVAKAMVIAHKGMIRVSSEREVGTEFIVLLPLKLKEIDEKNMEITFDNEEYIKDQHLEYDYSQQTQDEKLLEEKETGNDNDKEKPSLLIVEDNTELLSILDSHFSKDYNVMTAQNGQQGIDVCKQNYPDTIISDVMMPVMNGVDMCKKIRNDMSLAYLPIILLTAKSSIESQIEGYENGADLYIPKPFSMRLLDLNVKRLLEHKKMIVKGDGESGETRKLVLKSKEQEFIDNLEKIILENMSNENMSIEFLCEKMAIGRTKLYAMVKDITSIPLGDYIRGIKLKEAARLIRTTDMNITEVIYETGFGSNSYFSKIFKMKYNMTPTEYMKGKMKE